MTPNNRRTFLQKTAQGTAGLAAASFFLSQHPLAYAANDRINLGCIGLGGRGDTLARGFARHEGVKIAALCDPDQRRTAPLFNLFKSEHNPDLLQVQDFRRILDHRDIDAVVVATPDHWHALPTIYACQAGKDVYVEKPASHSLWEGRKMTEAARKYQRIVQVGTQTRSGAYVQQAVEYIRSGKLGKIPLGKIFNLKPGDPYREGKPASVPAELDWDLWLGPAPMREYKEGLERGWYHYWDFCGGDMSNDSIHQIDLARLLIGKDFPKAAYSTGGNFAHDDDREVPDTQTATFEYDDMVVTFYNTNYPPYMAKIPMEIRNQDIFPYWYQNATRVELYGTEGLMVIGRHGGGWQVFTKDGEVVAQEHGRFPEFEHRENFLHCVRTRETPNADIEEGHRSAILVHLGNLSYRLGHRRLEFDAATETTNDPDANRLLKRTYREPYTIPEQV